MDTRTIIGIVLMAPGTILLALTLWQVYKLDKKVFYTSIVAGVIGYAMFQGYLMLVR